MIGNLYVSRLVFRATHLFGKNGAKQVLGIHACDLRRHFLATAKPRQRQCHARGPAPARGEHRRGEQRLYEYFARAVRMQIARDLGKLEAVRRGEREDDAVLGRRRLQLEIELATEALAQREPPGAIDATAIRRMHDELHATGLVEEALEHDGVVRGQATECGTGGGEIGDDLHGRCFIQADRVGEPGQGGAFTFAEPVLPPLAATD